MDDIPLFPYTLNEIGGLTNEVDDIFYRRSIEMIDIGFNNGLDKVTLFKLDEGGEELYLNLPSSAWVKTLKDSISYFESTEEYEECEYAKTVLERIV